MRTSEHLAEAAGHLAVLLCQGQEDLVDERDLTVAAQARDQVAAGLTGVLRTVLAQLDALGGLHETVQAATALVPALTARTGDLSGPGPRELAADPPTSRSARAWVHAATQIAAAGVQARQAEQATAPDLRAAGADLAVLVGALVSLDVDLAAALTASGLNHAGQALLASNQGRSHQERVHRNVRTALNVLDAEDLPAEYHLTPPVVGVVPVSGVHLITAAVRRVTALLDRYPVLTAAQHAAVAMETARLAHQLRRYLAADAAVAASLPAADVALQRFTQAHLGLAHVWGTTSHLWCPRAGSWDAPAQLQAINRLLAEQTAPGSASGQVLEAISLLPSVATTVATGFDQSLAREEWIAAYQDGTGQRAWAVVWPDYGPEARGLKPAASDIAPVDVHLAGHAVHETWHDRGIPVEGYRLGDPIEDRRVGSPGGVAELTRIHVALEATTATGHGLRTAVGPPPIPIIDGDAASARRWLTAKTPGAQPATSGRTQSRAVSPRGPVAPPIPAALPMFGPRR